MFFGILMVSILCVEHDQHLNNQLTKTLLNAGYDVLSAHDGIEALYYLTKTKPELILCAADIPKLNGYALLEYLRKHCPECATLPFIFLLNKASAKNVIQCKKIGADDYLQKPANPELLLALVKSNLQRTERYQSHYASLSQLIQNRDYCLELLGPIFD